MINSIYLAIYGMSFLTLGIVVAVCLVGIFLCCLLLPEKVKAIVGIIGTVLAVLLILYVTLLSRTEAAGGVILIPGYSIRRAMWNREYLRMVLMNVFLFVPYGLFAPMIFRNGFWKVVGKTLLTGLCLTIFVELLQYITGAGCAEVDDVICNMAGVIVGLIPYAAAYPFSKKLSGKKK